MKRVMIIRGSDDPWSKVEPYEAALRMAGLEPVAVPPAEAAGLDGFGGLMLMGGTDVNPSRYGEDRAPETQWPPDDARDEAELRLIGEALDRDLPVLAICRGLQILNVQHVGTLIQHLDDNLGHRVTDGDRSKPVHDVDVMPGTKLARILGEPKTVSVNSRHHQAAGIIGDRLVLSAQSKDGVIEGLERPDKRFVVAVQWHPENQAPVDARQARLFRAFAQAVQQFEELPIMPRSPDASDNGQSTRRPSAA